MATILVVDDEKNYRWMLEELLEGEEHDVLTCDKVSDALEVLRESRMSRRDREAIAVPARRRYHH